MLSATLCCRPSESLSVRRPTTARCKSRARYAGSYYLCPRNVAAWQRKGHNEMVLPCFRGDGTGESSASTTSPYLSQSCTGTFLSIENSLPSQPRLSVGSRRGHGGGMGGHPCGSYI